ncbi:MAG: transporter [Crocinitomicaceae bacterium]|jgi:multidrug efflux pump subunit AcrA (membrane-fusion protein)|nr:transporter [Crocinitomicaceae bacterium]
MKNCCCLLLMILLLFSCSKKTETASPEQGDITESVYASGIVKSEGQYQVYPRSNGTLEALFVQEGDVVKDGQVLFSIYNETSKLSRENAQLQAEFSSFENNQDKLRELKMNIDLARNKMRNDSINFERQKSLYRQEIISRNTYEQSELLYENSKTAYRSAQLRYNDLQRQLSFSSRQSQRNLEISRNMESDFLVKSEQTGKVYAILKEKGEMVNMQTPVAIIGDAERFLVELQIDENDIVRIRTGQKLVVILDSYKDQTFEAQVTKINPYLNERSRTFTVEAAFTQKPPQLYPNLSLEANIVVSSKKGALLIPRKFLVDDTYVIRRDGKKIKVKTGLKDYQKVEILSGISKNDVLTLPE